MSEPQCVAGGAVFIYSFHQVSLYIYYHVSGTVLGAIYGSRQTGKEVPRKVPSEWVGEWRWRKTANVKYFRGEVNAGKKVKHSNRIRSD